MIVVHHPRHHNRNLQLCRGRTIRSCQSSFSKNESFYRRNNNGKLSYSITLHLTTLTLNEEDDDGGSFFLEASRQAARERQLQSINASSSSSTLLPLGDDRDDVGVPSSVTGSIYDTKAPSIEVKSFEEAEEEIDADPDAEKYQIVVVKEKEDEESRDDNYNDEKPKIMDNNTARTIFNGVMAVEAAPALTENDETAAVVGNDDDIILQLMPPSRPSITELRSMDGRVSDNASSLGNKNESPLEMLCAHELSDENIMMGEGETKPTKQEARFSSDGKVIFEPISGSVGEINQENVDMGLLVLTRALLTVKSILDSKE